MAKSQKFSNNIRIENRKARFDYEIVESYEAGIELAGWEVKSLRLGQASLKEAYASVHGNQIFIKNMHIKPYEQASEALMDPYRERRLLLKRHEINRMIGATAQKGFTLVPLKLYFNNKGWAKIELGLCRGKKQHDKRQVIKERTIEREMRREFKVR